MASHSHSSSNPPHPPHSHPPGDGRNSGNQRNAAAGRNYVAVARGSDLVVIRVVGKGNMLTAPALSDFAEEQRRAGFTRFLFDMERCDGLDSTFMGVMVGMHAALASDSGRMPKVVVPEDAKHKLPQDEPAARKAVAGDHPEMTALSPQEALKELEERFHGKPDVDGTAPPQPTVENEETALSGIISAVNVPAPVRDLMAMLGVDKFVKTRGTCDLKQLETTILPEKNLPPNERRKLILKAHETLVDIDKRNEAQFGAFLKALSSELSKE